MSHSRSSRRTAHALIASAVAVSFGGTLVAPTFASPAPATHTPPAIVKIQPGDTIVAESGSECTVTETWWKPAPGAKTEAYADYGVNAWGILKGNCGSTYGFWVRTVSDEIRGIVTDTPLEPLTKILPSQTKTMAEMGEPAYLKGQKDKGVIGWMISTGVGMSFLAVNRLNAVYVGPADIDDGPVE